MKKILFSSFSLIFLLGFSNSVFALQHWAGDFVKDVHKNCEEKYDKKDCEQSCSILGGTADKWDVALREKTLCIEIVCKEYKNGTETKKREIYGQKQEYEIYTPCGVLCDNIKDQHYLCVEEKVKKYCQGNGYDEVKCKKYCDKGSNKNSLCPGFVDKSLEKKKKEDISEIKESPREELSNNNIEPAPIKSEDINNDNLLEKNILQEKNENNTDSYQKNDSGLIRKVFVGFKEFIKKLFFWN